MIEKELFLEDEKKYEKWLGRMVSHHGALGIIYNFTRQYVDAKKKDPGLLFAEIYWFDNGLLASRRVSGYMEQYFYDDGQGKNI